MESAGIATETGWAVAMESAMAARMVSFTGTECVRIGPQSKEILKNFESGKTGVLLGFFDFSRTTGGEHFKILNGENLVFGGWKTGIAKGYLGTQGTRHDKGAMDESEKLVSCGEDMESDFKRLGIESVNVTFQSLTGRIAEGEEGIEKHGFL